MADHAGHGALARRDASEVKCGHQDLLEARSRGIWKNECLSAHCRACQCARICWSSPSGVWPVSTSPELLIALHRLCSTTQKPW